MENLVAGLIFEVVIFGFLMNLMILSCCMKKKKPVEDFMVHPKFNEPLTTRNQQPADHPKMAKEKPPNVEHTVSIKMENKAGDSDMQGPHESLSRDPMSDVPGAGIKAKPKQKIDGVIVLNVANGKSYKSNPELKTPPSKSKKASKHTAKNSSRTQSRKKREPTLDEKDEDATQELKPTREDGPPSNKPASKISVRKRKTKSVPKTGREKNKSKRAVPSIRTQTTTRITTTKRGGGKPATPRGPDVTKDLETTQNEEE